MLQHALVGRAKILLKPFVDRGCAHTIRNRLPSRARQFQTCDNRKEEIEADENRCAVVGKIGEFWAFDLLTLKRSAHLRNVVVHHSGYSVRRRTREAAHDLTSSVKWLAGFLAKIAAGHSSGDGWDLDAYLRAGDFLDEAPRVIPFAILLMVIALPGCRATDGVEKHFGPRFVAFLVFRTPTLLRDLAPG
jgi:hypothetical protein